MSHDRAARALSHATAQVLEQMFFAEVIGEVQPMADTTGHTAAVVEFSGASKGRLTLSLPSDTAGTLAADFLGLDSPGELRDGQAGEVVCELANMICGALLSSLEANRTFHLQSPRVVPALTAPPAAVVGRSFDLGTGHLTVWLEGAGEA